MSEIDNMSREELTDAIAIEIVRKGLRVGGRYSSHPSEQPELCPSGNHNWRVLYCDSNEDVVECRQCGKQRLSACNFDDEMA